MTTKSFIRKGKHAEPDYEAVLFDGVHPGEVITFWISRQTVTRIEITWDSVFVGEIRFHGPFTSSEGFHLQRNRWLVWDVVERRFSHAGTDYVQDYLQEIE